MAILRFLWAFLTSRWLWTLIGLALPRGDHLDVRPARRRRAAPARSPSEIVAARRSSPACVILWLVWLIIAQRRAIRANRLFVAELAAPEAKPLDPAAEGVAAVGASFQEVHGRAQAPQARRPQASCARCPGT